MNVVKQVENTEVNIALEGRLDTMTSPQLEKELQAVFKETADISLLSFDLEKLEYISSAGLRVILMAQKQMNKKGKMVIKNVNEVVMEVFEVTGFVDILTVE
jgi:anti-sigma B factor antagonist